MTNLDHLKFFTVHDIWRASCTYPQMVPRKRFIMKKAPTKISETKYSHGHPLPVASFT